MLRYWALIFSIGFFSSNSYAFLWEDNSNPFLSSLSERLFPRDIFQSPQVVYRTSETRYVNSYDASTQPPIIELAQAEPRPMLRNARTLTLVSPQPLPLPPGPAPQRVLMPESGAEVIVSVPNGQATAYGPLPASLSLCPPGFLCCDSGAVYRNAYKLLTCCGEHAFDSRYERCVDKIVTSSLQPGLSGIRPPERLTHITCSGQLYFGPKVLRCCNGTLYDSTKFSCTSGTTSHAIAKIWDPPQMQTFSEDLFELPEAGPGPYGPQYVVCEIYRYRLSSRDLQTWGCCGAQIYNFRRENCTGGEITPQRPLHRQKAVPQGELMVYCSGGVQHWVNPAVLPQIRCCGSSLCPIYPQPSSIMDDKKRATNDEQNQV